MKLQTENISKQFDGVPILEDINIHLQEGELVCLLGVSGGGKTTLFNLIAGLSRPDSGRVLLDGQDVTGRPGQVSYMLQKDLLLPFRSVADNVALPLLIQGMDKKAARERVLPHFEPFGLAGTQDQYPGQLSGGMRQRAALLRTYMFGRSLALLDEPFSALDTITKGNIHRWYLGVMEKIRLSTLFITQDIDEAILLSDRIYILAGRPGRITHEIPILEPRPRPADFPLTPAFLDYKREIIESMHLNQ